jgi:transcriptional regulator with XRE-family HTH domain
MNQKAKEFITKEEISEKEFDLIMQISKLRISQKITQSELSKKTGISQPNIARFEKNTHSASLSTTIKILSALGYDLTITKKKN